jgi:hypothetical protein
VNPVRKGRGFASGFQYRPKTSYFGSSLKNIAGFSNGVKGVPKEPGVTAGKEVPRLWKRGAP